MTQTILYAINRPRMIWNHALTYQKSDKFHKTNAEENRHPSIFGISHCNTAPLCTAISNYIRGTEPQ